MLLRRRIVSIDGSPLLVQQRGRRLLLLLTVHRWHVGNLLDFLRLLVLVRRRRRRLWSTGAVEMVNLLLLLLLLRRRGSVDVQILHAGREVVDGRPVNRRSGRI